MKKLIVPANSKVLVNSNQQVLNFVRCIPSPDNKTMKIQIWDTNLDLIFSDVVDYNYDYFVDPILVYCTFIKN